MSAFDAAGVVETRDRLRSRLEVLSQYDRVLREQLIALQQEDFDRFARLGEERDALGSQLTSVSEGIGSDETQQDSHRVDGDLETARLVAEIHRQSSELSALDDRVLGALTTYRGLLRNEIDKASAPVSDGAVRYMEAESGGDGPDRLDVVL